MDFAEFSDFIPKDGEKFVFLEKGKPVLVLMSFDEYKKIREIKDSEEVKLLADNDEKNQLSEESNKMENVEMETEEGEIEDNLTLEDLPF